MRAPTTLIVILLSFVLQSADGICQDAEQEGWDDAAYARWQSYYRQIASQYEIVAVEAGKDKLTVTDQPVFSYKYAQQFRKSHGAFYVWSSGQRPYVVGCLWSQLEPWGKRTVVHELHSLSPGKITATWKDAVSWEPVSSTIEFKAVPDTKAPSEQADKLESEMRTVAKKFDGTTHREQDRQLILLPKPLYEYRSEQAGILCGGLFGLFDGRDAEIFVLIEAQQANHVREWKYAVAPFSEAPLTLRHAKQVVWTAPKRVYDDPTQPFFAPRPAQHAPDLKDVILPEPSENR